MMISGFVQDLQTMTTLHFAVFAGVVCAIVLGLFYLIWRNFHRARLIEDTPTAKVRSAPQGYVELEGGGRSLPEQTIVAPLSKTPCLWYRFKIEKEKRNSRGPDWSKVESGNSQQPFVFYDDTGECLVDPRKAEVTPGVKKVWYGNSKWPGGGENRGLLGGLLGTRYRYTEERIDTGSVYLLGWFDTIRSTDRSVREEVAVLLRHWKQNPSVLKQRFDRNRDGDLDESEWQQAREVAHRQVLQDRAGRSAQDDVHIMRAGAHDGHPFLISAKPQFQLTGRYRRHAMLSMVGSAAAAGFLAWMLTVRF